MTEIFPAGAFGQPPEFAEGESPRRGQASIGSSHGISEDESCEKINADRREKATPEIGNQDIFALKLAKTGQQMNFVSFIKMV